MRKPRIHCEGAKSRAIRSMALVIREVIRSQKRQWLREAKSICLSFDDRKAYKLLKFNCSAPLRQRGAPNDGPWRSGIIGCLNKVHGDTLENMDNDYAVRVADKVLEMIRAFATSYGQDVRDEDLCEHILKSTHAIVVDGALLKAANLLRQHMPNVILIWRDPAHAVRTAVSEPWDRTNTFLQLHLELFSGRNALLKSVQFSEVMQARLLACQADVVGERGSQGGGMNAVLKHFSWAPHRWESFAQPRR